MACKHCGSPACRADFVTATGDDVMPVSEYLRHALLCRDAVSKRALAAEKQLATLAERVKALKQAHRFACFVKYSGCVCDVDMGGL